MQGTCWACKACTPCRACQACQTSKACQTCSARKACRAQQQGGVQGVQGVDCIMRRVKQRKACYGVQDGVEGVQGVLDGQGLLDSAGVLLTLSWSHFRNAFLLNNHRKKATPCFKRPSLASLGGWCSRGSWLLV